MDDIQFTMCHPRHKALLIVSSGADLCGKLLHQVRPVCHWCHGRHKSTGFKISQRNMNLCTRHAATNTCNKCPPRAIWTCETYKTSTIHYLQDNIFADRINLAQKVFLGMWRIPNLHLNPTESGSFPEIRNAPDT